MTKKLEDILNLPNVKEAFAKVDEKEKNKKNEDKNGYVAPKNVDPKTAIALEKTYKEFDKISASLPQVKGLGEISDLELDKLASEAEESYKNLMDLGMNVDSRYSGRIFEVASTMLRNAIDAKGSKIDKKLKMVELQLKKLKIDKTGGDDLETVESEGVIISDRNELMKKLLKKDDTEDSKKD
jgi:hypothetical protein